MIPAPCRAAAAALFALLLAALAGAQPTALVDVRVIDVVSGEVQPGRMVIIDEGRIVDIVDAALADIPAGATVIEGDGRWVIPGLFDAHTHFTASPTTFAPMLLAHGVTAVRDLGAPTGAALAMRARAADPANTMPRMFVTGAIIDGDPPIWPFSEPVTNPEEGRAAVDKLADAGVDMIKVYSGLPYDAYRAIVAQAHARGLMATGHIPESATVADAIAAGQDCNEHLQRMPTLFQDLLPAAEGDRRGVGRFSEYGLWPRMEELSDDVLRDALIPLVESGMTQCPTLAVYDGISQAVDPEKAARDPRMAYVPEGLRGFWSMPGYANVGRLFGASLPQMIRLIGLMHDAGVPLMVGTDVANPYVYAGFAVHEEMAMFQQAGVAPIDILRAATTVPAAFCGADDEIGRLAPGYAASMVVLAANPLDDIANTQQIDMVIDRGRVYDRAALDELLDAARQAAGNPLADAGDGADDALEATGDVVYRGVYRSAFNDMPAGHEDFLITRTDNGHLHVVARNIPTGGFQDPFHLVVETNGDRELVAAVYDPLTDDGQETARFVVEGDQLRGRTDSDAAAVEIDSNAMIVYPSYAADFLVLPMITDIAAERTMIAFGVQGWTPVTMPWRIVRADADPPVTTPAGVEGVYVYEGVMQTPSGPMNQRIWSTADGLPVRSEIDLPWGTFVVELAELARE